MPTKLSALTQATILGAADLLYAVVGGNSRAIPALAMAGRNRIINGQGRINQRGYVSGTATTGSDQYTLDRWRVLVSGQNLTFTGDASRRTMTAPAGGAAQTIESVNIEGGTYVINWSGTASCTVNGTARAKGDSFTLPANTNATVTFSGGTFTDVQLELGTTATPYERLPVSDEIARCQRYYCKSYFQTTAPGTVTNNGAVPIYVSYPTQVTNFFGSVPVRFPVDMRAAPTVTIFNPNTLNLTGSFRAHNQAVDLAATASDISTAGATLFINNQTVLAGDALRAHFTANAEI